MRKFSKTDDYLELYGRVRHKANNLRLLVESKRIKNNRKLVWRKQRAKDILDVLEAVLASMPEPKKD